MGTLQAGVGQGATVVANLLGSEAVNVGVAVQDKLLGVLVQLLKIVGGVVEVLAPVETEPADVGQNGLDVLDILACGVGVVEAHVAPGARKLLADSEIKADGLGVADVQITVGFGRKAGDDAAIVGAGRLIVGDDAPDEVGGFIPPGIFVLNGHGSSSLWQEIWRRDVASSWIIYRGRLNSGVRGDGARGVSQLTQGTRQLGRQRALVF